MRDLHVIAVSDDGRHVVLAPTKGAAKGTYRVRLDARLIAAVRGELPGSEPTVELSPKEIQTRLRAGESAEQIARSAGVAVTRVERFAGPVAGEMDRMISAARDGFVLRGRRGPSALPLGEAVDASVGKDATWTTRREDDGRWRVAVAWQARGRSRAAAWLYEPTTRVLTPADPASAALGHIDSTPRTPARKAPAAKAATAKAPTAKAPAKPATKPATKGATKAATKPAAKRPATTTPAKQAPERAPRKTPAQAGPPARPRLQVVPTPAPAARTKQPATPAPADRDGVRTRAIVPGWADVLLGTTPGADRQS